MPIQAIAPAVAGEPAGQRVCAAPVVAPPRRRAQGHLSDRHPLAAVVRDRCRREHPLCSARIGSIGCGQCWEYAIRVDERVMVEHDLPPLVRDDSIVDEVAVKRAISGEPVHLTRTEKAAAVGLLAGRGLSVASIAVRLRMNMTEVAKLRPTTQAVA